MINYLQWLYEPEDQVEEINEDLEGNEDMVIEVVDEEGNVQVLNFTTDWFTMSNIPRYTHPPEVSSLYYHKDYNDHYYRILSCIQQCSNLCCVTFSACIDRVLYFHY